jgi:hypothetical protein
MKVISWIFTIAALVAIVGCFFREEILFIAAPLVIAAAWTDSLACDIELRNFREKK